VGIKVFGGIPVGVFGRNERGDVGVEVVSVARINRWNSIAEIS